MALSLSLCLFVCSVFIHRYRDCAADVRKDTLTALGEVIKAYPAVFLKDEYTKYIGWLLYDEVRSCCCCVAAVVCTRCNVGLVAVVSTVCNGCAVFRRAPCAPPQFRC